MIALIKVWSADRRIILKIKKILSQSLLTIL